MGRESVLFKLLQVLGQSANPPAAVFFFGKKVGEWRVFRGKIIEACRFSWEK
jgi:hypothetical protein